MRTHVHQWGNSLALRIPKAYAREVKVEKGSAIDLSLKKGKLVVTPIRSSPYSLKKLIAGINKKNIHKEEDFGLPQGKEIW